MNIDKYQPSKIEPKWQERWKKSGVGKTNLSDSKNKYYLLVEFPYSSGDLHIGHWFAFAVTDIFGRFKKMQGFNVFFPVGFDSFGLPAENAAIKRGLHPRDWTLKNIEAMSKQFKLMGAILDWEHVIITCLPEYYRWNQWIFLKMMEKGIAYRGKTLSNWCPTDKTVLADEQVVSGKCDRCGSDVVLKEVEQWFLKITAYADKLLWKGNEDVDWPKSVRDGQNNWIGKSEGALVKFEVEGSKLDIEVFTTRPDTLFGATFLVLSPEHPIISKIASKNYSKDIERYQKASEKKSAVERQEMKEKTGVFTGSFAINPVNGEKIPIWIADYVLMGYGTGAIMSVPAHDQRDFEFAKKYDLSIRQVVKGSGNDDKEMKEAYSGEGELINSGDWNGWKMPNEIDKVILWLEKKKLGKGETTYHLHDWSISRQRYWGTPIPIINCDKCGAVPVPYEDLPVELPYKVDHSPKGKPPLATAEEWMKVKCPKCGGDATREPETMDGFVDNSWYFFRYLSPKDGKQIFNKDLSSKWMPVDVYFGGAEHTLGHTLYSRFFTKFFKDIGIYDFPEYAKKRVNHGVILGPDSKRMSKSRGNIVNPDEEVKQYGADTIRTYLAFIGPYDLVAPWDPGSIRGVYNFLKRVYRLGNCELGNGKLSAEDAFKLNKTVKKVSDDLDNVKFNTAVAALMEWLNYLTSKESVLKEEIEAFLILLAPFAPHLCEEVWEMIGSAGSVHEANWPEFDEKMAKQKAVTLVVQVNGKVRDRLTVDVGIGEEEAKKLALESEKVQKFLGNKEIKKTVFVSGKLISFVV